MSRRSIAGSGSISALAMILVCGMGASFAHAGVVEAVNTIAAQAPSNPKSNVPGGTSGNPTAQFTNFNNEIYRTPNGQKWYMVPTTSALPNTQDQVLILGQGLTSAVLAQEGITQINPGAPTAEFLNFSRLDVPRLNDSGQYAMAFRLGVTGASATDDRVVRFTPGTGFDLYIKSTDPVGARPSSAYTGGFGGATITQSGGVGFMGLVDFAASGNDWAFTNNGNTIAIESFVTTPANAVEPWQDVDTATFAQDASGLHTIAIGELGTDTSIDKVAVVDGLVVIRKGSVIAGSSFTSAVSGISEGWMETDGTWFVRGSNADGVTWIVRNGTVIAASGQPITPGSTELWESFRDMKGDDAGNFVVNGNTNAASLTDDVLVYNGKRVLARESDAIDLDSNGTADNLYLHLVQDRGALLNDDYFYFASRLKDSPTATAGASGSNNATLLRVRVCRADFDDSGAISVNDVFEYLNAWFAGNIRANIDGVDGVTVNDIFAFLNAWFAGC